MNRPPLPEPLVFHVPDEKQAVPAARKRVIQTARGWRVPLTRDALADVELLAGELISNAVRHSGGPCSVTVRWNGTRLRTEVSDGCPRPPRRSYDADGTSGRGLVLVDALAYTWGWDTHASGKTVWFEVATEAVKVDTPRLSTLVRAAAPAWAPGRIQPCAATV